MLIRALVGIVDHCRRHALAVFLAGFVLAGLSGLYAVTHMGVVTDTDAMFSPELPWRKQAIAMKELFPQFHDLIAAVVEARTPEEADATAEALAAAVAADPAHFHSVRQPDASPYLKKQGLLLLDTPQLTTLMDQTIDAQPFLGQLVADPSARGLFSALALLGMGVAKSDVDLAPYLAPIRTFHQAIADVLAGKPQPLSWQNLLGASVADLAGRYRFVLIQPQLDYGALEPGGAATQRLRQIISQLEFVRAGTAHVRLTGQVPLADEEFSTVAQGAVEGLFISVVLIALWLFLAVRSWRLIGPILLTLGLGLMLTVLFAAVAVGTLNLVSVGFGVLFVGIAVDFAIQFSVRYREQRHLAIDATVAMARTAAGAGHQILLASLATAAGFLAFVPTDFSGVAELGLIAGIGMLIAFVCTLTFLPAAITIFRPPGEAEEVGFAWAARFDRLTERFRWPVLGFFVLLAVLGASLSTRLTFDADPLHTKNPDTEAMQTLRDLIESPLTNPYTIEILAKDQAEVDSLTAKLKALPAVGGVISIFSFVPQDQAQKLAVIADANTILAPTLAAHGSAAPVTPQEIRLAAQTALAQIEAALPKLPPDHPLVDTATDLKKLVDAPDPVLMATNAALTRFLPAQLDRLRMALSAEPSTVASIPPDIARDWIAPDGRFRLQVNATPETLARGALREFVDEVRSVAPQAAGSAVTIEATSETIVGAFRSAAIYAVIAIAVILAVALRRVVDVLLVLAPLLLSALLTLLIVVLLPLPLNFANIIALPLLLGVGVSFNIYFVMNWRVRLPNPLRSATAKAIVFSALTTSTAFGSLALSAHPGTASMGDLLLISLGCTLVATMAFVPALLAAIGPPRGV